MQQPQPPEPMIRPTLYKDRVSTGTHNYFLDLKQATNGSKYVVIDQQRLQDPTSIDQIEFMLRNL